MFMAAAKALSKVTAETCTNKDDPLLPPISDMVSTVKIIAHAIALQCIADGKAGRHADKSADEIKQIIEDTYWEPAYARFKIDDTRWSDHESQAPH